MFEFFEYIWNGLGVFVVLAVGTVAVTVAGTVIHDFYRRFFPAKTWDEEYAEMIADEKAHPEENRELREILEGLTNHN